MPSSRQVTRLEQLRYGDHISFDRSVYYHHAIVIKVTSSSMTIISFTSPDEELVDDFFASMYDKPRNPDPSKKLAHIAMEVYPLAKFQQETVYLYQYDEGCCSDRDVVVRRAIMARNGEIDWKPYDLITNNCEHFVSWCKTGEKSSKQVKVAGGVMLVAGAVGLLGAGLAYLIKSATEEDSKERQRSYYY